MEFYKIWRGWGGTIGVHKMSLGDLAMNYLVVLVVYFILLGVLVTFLPTILIGLYLLWIIGSDMEYGQSLEACQQRVMLNILTIVSVVYFMIDFHFGLISFNTVGAMTYKETMDGLAIWNLSIGIISVILIFFGHHVYSMGSRRIFRIFCIIALCYGLNKFTKPLSSGIVNNVITQCETDESVNDSRQSFIDQERYENGEYVPFD
jgi:hypothetical protein